MRSSGVQLVCFLSVGLLPCILGRARPRSGLREAMRRRTGEEVDEITPIKSIEEVISMLPVKSIQEVKSVQGIDDDVAKAAIKRFGLKNKLAARSAGGLFDDYTSDYSQPPFHQLSKLSQAKVKIAELTSKLMECRINKKPLIDQAESEEEEVGGLPIKKLYGESVEEVTPIKNIEEVKSLDEIKSIDEVKKIQELKSVEEVKSMLPVKSVEEVKSITPVKSVQEVKNLYELTDAQARELSREIRSYNRLIMEE